MKCFKAINVKGQLLPCGQCINCRINKQRKWAARIIMEYMYHPQRSYFVTLTYKPEKLPKSEIVNDKGEPCGSLAKKKFLQWLKNVQKDPRIGVFRYYAVGEYGDLNGRAHYHLAVFPEHPSQVMAVCGQWERRYGWAKAAEINSSRASYLAQYTTKKLTGIHKYREGQEPLFRTSSRSPPLGSAFVADAIRVWKQPKMQKVIADRGDVEPVFRAEGKVWPIGDWALQKIRKELGIPLLKRERMAHPAYYENNLEDVAEWNPEMAMAMDIKLTARQRNRLHRGSPRI